MSTAKIRMLHLQSVANQYLVLIRNPALLEQGSERDQYNSLIGSSIIRTGILSHIYMCMKKYDFRLAQLVVKDKGDADESKYT